MVTDGPVALGTGGGAGAVTGGFVTGGVTGGTVTVGTVTGGLTGTVTGGTVTVGVLSPGTVGEINEAAWPAMEPAARNPTPRARREPMNPRTDRRMNPHPLRHMTLAPNASCVKA